MVPGVTVSEFGERVPPPGGWRGPIEDETERKPIMSVLYWLVAGWAVAVAGVVWVLAR